MLTTKHCWNTYPSTNFSSAALHFTHILLLAGVAKQLIQTMRINNAAKKEQQEQQKEQREQQKKVQ